MSTAGREPRTPLQRVADSRLQKFTRALVRWYDPDRRPFPWRQSNDPYYVAVCEILLQRTNAEKVATAVDKLFCAFPEPDDLARASRSGLAQILQPLGLPHRIEQIRQVAFTFATARERETEINADDLSRLPGIGPYSLAAVRVLALDQADALIDEHVLRVLRRVFSVHAPPRRHPTKALRQFAKQLVPPRSAKAYNLAILDLGRLICRPRRPKCPRCPVRRMCDYAAAEMALK